MNTGRGVFIAIEGTDGSGKGTQFKHITDRLIKEGYDVATFDFPQYELPSSYFVRQYLNGEYGSANDVGPYTSSLFYALDRFEAAPAIRKALQDGKVVVTNRYVGSNMAHQGTKFLHAEERRGYFIWLDNLEFEMLRIPRPTVSFVLRVPAAVAQGLVDQKAKRSYTDAKRDIHEADLEHLKKAVTVYDDMCQLFPKDFVRIDCTRDDKLLEVEKIHDILWQKIEPMLPAKKTKKPKDAPAEVTLPVPVKTVDVAAAELEAPAQDRQTQPATAHLAGIHLAMREISTLGAKKLEWSRLASYVELPANLVAYDQKDAQGNYRYYVPDYFDSKMKEQYRAHMDQIFNLYAEMAKALTEYLGRENPAPKSVETDDWLGGLRVQALEAVRGVLPVAATTTVGVYGSAQAIESIIANLLSDPLPEAYETAKELLGEARVAVPTFMDGVDLANDVTYRTAVKKRIRAIAREHLPAQYANASANVRLTDIWPRNEFDLIPDMLYDQTTMSVEEIKAEVAQWPYQRKAGVIETYIGDRSHRNQRPGRALEKAHYSWDLMSEFDTFRDLQRHRMIDTLEWQELTPRYGYDVPKLVEDADLTDQYESCFDLSLRLHGFLQSAGYGLEAQYATLQGHKMRWKMTYNAREAFHLHELRSGAHNKAGVRKLVLEMHEKLAEKHPMLAEAMKFVGEDNA